MKKLFSGLILLVLPLVFLVTNAGAQISFTAVDSLTATPNSNDTIGAFARIFYHQPRNKYYLVYAARQYNSTDPAGMLRKYAWREYDGSLNFTGNCGYLPGYTSAGDFAMQMIDSTYYHLSVYMGGDYLLAKFDDDFNLLDTTIIHLDNCDSNIDQLMNYTNGRLVIGAMQETTACPPLTPPQPTYVPYSHVFQYDLNLNPIAADVVTTPTNICWGSSMIYNGGNYYQVTMNNFNNHQLYAYKYDTSFSFVSQTLLSNDGQWSQGVLWDAPYYYVAYHTGEHNRGNVLLGVYDQNWTNITTINVSHYPLVANGFNANRPFLLRQGNLLYISYDVESYINAPPPVNQKDWQAHVMVFQVNLSSGVQEAVAATPNYTLFPVPARDFFNVKKLVPGVAGTLSVLNVNGEVVKTVQLVSDRERIDISNLAPGTYLYTITEKGKPVQSGKLQKN